MVGQKSESVKCKIDALEDTADKISARAGLAPIARYSEAIGITKLLAEKFSFLKKHEKGTPIRSFFHQVLTFFIDGTDLSMSRFDHIQNEPSNAGGSETKENYMSPLRENCFAKTLIEAVLSLFSKLCNSLLPILHVSFSIAKLIRLISK